MAIGNKIKILSVGDLQTIEFAASELKKYCLKMSGNTAKIVTEESKVFESSYKDALCLGLFDDFGLDFEVDDKKMDDAIYINVKNGCGIIAGINPRSVLLGVYRFLTEAGCRWVRPGADGEYIPHINILEIDAKIEEKPSYRHRGICIEGAVSYDNVADMIDWMPKVGFNAYFFQFRESFTFFDRWYSHVNNPTLTPEEFSVEKAREFLRELENEIKKRGLIYHGVGHGWTCEPLGIPGLGWDKVEIDVSPEVREYFALVNGKRDLWHGVPLNTSLCYSNEKVRTLIVNDIVKYIKEHRNIDILHFWLADGTNNQCECDNCRKMRPSDYYIKMLNELDEVLTQEKLHARIVFLVYVDLMWPPVSERIINPERFILMFAPITRTYSKSFSIKGDVPGLPPFKLNELEFPTSVEENISFLRAWQDMFSGDSFDFDYHFMWDHYIDQGYCGIARVLSQDIKNLRDLGLNGFVSCQVQRAFFPTGLGMYVMGKTLWNTGYEYEELAEDYFKSAFGEDALLCREYMEELTLLFDMDYTKGRKTSVSSEFVQHFGKIAAIVNGFRPVINKNVASQQGIRLKSWEYLKHHSNIAYVLALSLQAIAADNIDISKILWNAVEKYVQEHELELQEVFDVFEFITTYRGIFETLGKK